MVAHSRQTRQSFIEMIYTRGCDLQTGRVAPASHSSAVLGTAKILRKSLKYPVGDAQTCWRVCVTRSSSSSASCQASLRYRNTDRGRMPGKRSKKKKKKGKKACNRSSPALVGKPPKFLRTLHTGTTAKSAPGKFWGGPECSMGLDSAEYYRPSTKYRNGYDGDRFSGSDSVGSYYLYWDYRED
ncbi:hypothetical protein P4O66_001887 [Electrophorus voltai]|uniref:Uncharacterized protein n=1 Tax=Electrophorus voltai TaxID=2609070 RepID=A0AAD9DTG1_9TELE|nr:hypothetical protein P4O66_001887 [Electrophorus voltai]